MKPTNLEAIVLDTLGKRIADVFPNGVTFAYLPDHLEPPMSWSVTITIQPGPGARLYTARGFTLAGALMEAAANNAR